MNDVSFLIPMNSESTPTKEELTAKHLELVEAEIVARLHADAIDLQGCGDKQWTDTFKTSLQNIGLVQQPPRLTFPNNRKGDWEKGGEWLFDFVWVKSPIDESGSFDWRKCKGLALACESEWLTGEYHVLEDLLKLTFVYSDYRLFIYTNSIVGGGHPIDWCKKACPDSLYNRYLAIGFPGAEADCQIDLWIR